MIRDWDAKVGNKAESSIIGKFVLEVTKEAGDQSMDFCEATTCSSQTHASNHRTDDGVHGHHQMADLEVK